MIENGVLTYGAIQEGISSWRFHSDVLNEVVIAVLLSIISYQTVEMMLNLSFGLKARGQARLRDIQIMLLIRRSSFYAVLREILPWPRRGKKVTWTEPADDMSETDTDTGRRGFTIYACVYAKLFCLLLAIPLVNVGSVVLSLERDNDLTFAEAKFGGLALGVDFSGSDNNYSLISRTPKAFCEGVTVERNTADFPIALFRLCTRELDSTYEPTSRQNIVVVSVDSTAGNVVLVSVTIGSQKTLYEKRAMIVSDMANISSSERNGELYYVKSNFSVSDLEFLVHRGAERAQSMFCDHPDAPGIMIDQTARKGRASASAECPQQHSEKSQSEHADAVKDVILDLLDLISLRDNDQLLVQRDQSDVDGDIINGDDLLLLSRRRSLVSIPVMAILALAVVVLRVIVQLVTNNDLENGIGLIVRDGLGLPCCDSMLCSRDVVAKYDSEGRILFDVDRPVAFNGKSPIW